MRKPYIFEGLRKVYAWFTLAKLIWGRGQIAPDSFLRKSSLRMGYAWFTLDNS
jgi:hypothetical protein